MHYSEEEGAAAVRNFELFPHVTVWKNETITFIEAYFVKLILFNRNFSLTIFFHKSVSE